MHWSQSRLLDMCRESWDPFLWRCNFNAARTYCQCVCVIGSTKQDSPTRHRNSTFSLFLSRSFSRRKVVHIENLQRISRIETISRCITEKSTSVTRFRSCPYSCTTRRSTLSCFSNLHFTEHDDFTLFQRGANSIGKTLKFCQYDNMSNEAKLRPQQFRIPHESRDRVKYFFF